MNMLNLLVFAEISDRFLLLLTVFSAVRHVINILVLILPPFNGIILMLTPIPNSSFSFVNRKHYSVTY